MELKNQINSFLRRASRTAAAVTAALCAALMSAVGYYNDALPDTYKVGTGSGMPVIHTVLPVTAQELSDEGFGRAAYSELAGGESRRLSLRLFGSVPIKEVREEMVDRPMLAAGGSAFGIRLVTDGVMIIDMKKVSGSCPAEESGLRIGDVIESINGERVSTNNRVGEIIKASGGESCDIKYRRGAKTSVCKLTPVLNEGSYRAGMWVRDSSAGIGTMTFIDPDTLAFAGLGHAICDNDTHEELPLSKGSISDVNISGCNKSSKGSPGQLLGEFTGGESGELLLNCSGGVYGILEEMPEGYVTYPLAFAHEVHKGEAYILSQTDCGEPEEYSVEIESIGNEDGHDMVIKVTDKRLIEKTGGIVQGMSGSPIIQDGRIAGAVTHVFIDDPKGGYGIFAESMYEYACQAADDSSNESRAG